MGAGGKGKAQAAAPADPLDKIAQLLRGKGGVEERSAVLSLGPHAEGARVDYFRGVDLLRVLRKHRELVNDAAPLRDPKVRERAKEQFAAAAGDDAKRKELLLAERKRLDDQIGFVADQLIQRGYLRPAERMHKKQRLKDGAKRVKFPMFLELCAPPFKRDKFYAWTFDKPMSAWSYVYSALLVVFVIACCLLQVAPRSVKLVVLYSSTGLLGLMFGTIALRGLIFAAVWTVTGKSLWLLPYLLSDDVPINKILTPLWEIERYAGKPPPLWKRLALVGGICAALGVFYVYAPEGSAGAVGDATKHMHDQVLEMLNINDKTAKIDGRVMDNATDAAANLTDANATGANATGKGAIPPMPPPLDPEEEAELLREAEEAAAAAAAAEAADAAAEAAASGHEEL